jgi:ribosomal protein L7Ae-like RNA K-turn-binding protein
VESGRDDTTERLLGLLGLACRAGRLALGARAVTAMVSEGRRPLVIVARDAGASQRERLLRLAPVRRLLADAVDRQQLARALGRRELAVVAVADPDFVRGIEGIERLDGGGEDGRSRRTRGWR